jgi:cytidylate kinase
MREKEHLNIAVDGPVASGKGTATKGLSLRLGIPVLDTGAIYRAVAVYLLDSNIDINDEKSVLFALPRLDMRVFAIGGITKVWISGRDVSDEIRENRISILVSSVAAYSAVRDLVNEKIAEIARQGDFILEGRDIGTVVLPDAKYKFFITATVEERARRRMKELESKGEKVKLVDMIIQIKERDGQDMGRTVAPLKQAPDAVFIDTTDLTIEQTIDTMAKYIKL